MGINVVPPYFRMVSTKFSQVAYLQGYYNEQWFFSPAKKIFSDIPIKAEIKDLLLEVEFSIIGASSFKSIWLPEWVLTVKQIQFKQWR